MSSKDDFLMLLLAALAEPIGLLIVASDAERARQAFYSARRKANLPALQALQIRISPFPDGQLVICKERVQITSQPKENSDD